jgi:hypothetical protein
VYTLLVSSFLPSVLEVDLSNLYYRDKKRYANPVADQHSTLRRHMQADHPGAYRSWCTLENFESMLPVDAKKRRLAEDQATQAASAHQTQLDNHLRPIEAQKREVPYTDEVFRQAAIRWLIETDQVSLCVLFNMASYFKCTAYSSLQTSLVQNDDWNS